jgi:hypothetical protein
MTTHIYAVQGPDSFRLVEANSKHAAFRHVARDILTVERASQKTLVAAMQDGVKIEVAGAEEPEAATAE